MFLLECNVLYAKGRWVYVSFHGNSRMKILEKYHNSISRTFWSISDSYYWCHMQDDIEPYVKTCLVC